MKSKKIFCSILAFFIIFATIPKNSFALDIQTIEYNCCCNNYIANKVTDYSSQNDFTGEINKDIDYSYKEENDGRIWIDKSVTTDDNFNFSCGKVEPNSFDVILSAIGQDYNLSQEKDANIDVVFIVDTSSSMMNETSPTEKTLKAQVTVNSLNSALNYIMKNNKNRAGIVTFGGGDVGEYKTLLSMNHYNADSKSNSFVSFDNNSIKRVVSDSASQTDSVKFSGTTNFQKGIFGAYKIFKESAKTANGNLPIVIFLTDGVPIWYTINYKDESIMDSNVEDESAWQNAVLADTDDKRNCGAQSTTPLASYYSILTANYYKDKISKLYNKDTYFSTIGMLDESTVAKKTELYVQTLLNPSNINLAKCKNNNSVLFFEEVDSKAAKNPGMFVSCPLLTPQRLYQCLMAENDITSSYEKFDVILKSTGNNVAIPAGSYKITKNPYLKNGFNYADSAFTGQLTEDALSEIFHKIIVYSTRDNPIDKENDKITFHDTLNKNIKCTADKLTLRFGCKNYEAIKKNTYIDGENTVSDYICDEQVTGYKNETLNLNECSIKLLTNNDTGIQTLIWSFPRSLLPLYTESDKSQSTSPIRLIYPISLDNNVTSTNQLTHTNAYVNFKPALNNSYYHPKARKLLLSADNNIKYKVNPVTGEPLNPTDAPFDYIYKSTMLDNIVTASLGNNARILLTGNTINITKRWEDNNNLKIRPESITVHLLDGEEIIDTVNLDAATNWSYTWENLPTNRDGVDITYSIKEEPIDGYDTSIEDNIIINTYKNNTVSVHGTKIWDDSNNKNNTRPSSTTIYLLANNNIIDTKNIDNSNGWNYAWDNLPKYDESNNEISYSVREKAVPSYTTTYDGYNIINHYKPTVINRIQKTPLISPRTGDNSYVIVYSLLATSCSAAFLIIKFTFKKRTKQISKIK